MGCSTLLLYIQVCLHCLAIDCSDNLLEIKLHNVSRLNNFANHRASLDSTSYVNSYSTISSTIQSSWGSLALQYHPNRTTIMAPLRSSHTIPYAFTQENSSYTFLHKGAIE